MRKQRKNKLELLGIIGEIFEEHRRHHEEEDRIHQEFHNRVNEIQVKNRDIQRYYNRIKYGRPAIIIFNLLLWFALFHFFGVKGLSIVFAIIISMSGIFEFIFLMNLERRIFKPIEQLRAGVEEIGRGNYKVNVKCVVTNEISVLVDSFNKMAEKLQEGERLKLEYEENRKALVANISHDLKTPITSIQGYIEAMMDRDDISQENIDKYNRIIYNNAAYLNKLIDDLFLFSKLDMQKLELDLERISVKAFMNDLMEEFSFELVERGVDFLYEDGSSGPLFVEIDRKRMKQIFNNLIGNAVKHGCKESIQIYVRLFNRENEICIDVKDNGIGIPTDELAFVFDRFYRVDYARTKDLMSTGLGLAIAKELVEAQHGRLTVASEEKVGTCFTITLPPAGEGGNWDEKNPDYRR